MATKKRADFLDSDEGRDALRQLSSLSTNAAYNTPPTYTPNATLYPDNLMPFVDRHMEYLLTHPQVNINIYIANLRLKARVIR